MEENRKRSKSSINDRLERVELDIKEIRAQIALLDRAGTGLQMARGDTGVPAYAETRAPVEVFCAYCFGGNPPDAPLCMWCGRPMPQKGIEFAPGAQQSAVRFPDSQSAAEEPRPAPVYTIAPIGGTIAPVGATPPPPPRPRRPAAVGPPKAAPHTPGFNLGSWFGTKSTGEAARAESQTPGFNFDFLKRSEFWLNKVGIGLLLLGLAFFFKYSIDRDWLNKEVRIALGLLLGSVLLGFGLALHSRRRHFSQILIGGSIATYYITGYAAYQLLNLVPYEVAFGFMALVTALAFAIAVRQDEAILSLVGLVGGLLTPFVLEAPSAGVVGLITYTCIVLTGAIAIYLYRGWRSLLWLGFVGGWTVFAMGWLDRAVFRDTAMSDLWALQGAAIFAFVVFWAVPVLREVLYERNPERWSRPSLGRASQIGNVVNRHVHVLAILIPLLTLGYSRVVWQDMVTEPEWGWITLGVAAVYGAAAWLMRRSLPQLAYTHVLMSILLVTLGVAQILEGYMLILALAVEATALHFVSQRLSDRGLAIYGHVLSVLMAVWLGGRMATNLFAEPRLTASTLTDLAVIALLAASSFAVWPKELTILYRFLVHAGVLGWIFTQLYALPNWTGMVMLAWAAYGAALYVAHMRLPAQFGKIDMAYPTHAIFALAGLLFAWRIYTGQAGELSVLNVKMLLDAAMVAAVAGMSFIIAPRKVVVIYRTAAHLGVLALLWRELWVLQDGLSYVMLSWALYGLGMHYLARLLPDPSESKSLSLAANVPFVGVALWLVQDIRGPAPDAAVFNLPALLSLTCIGLALGASFFAKPRQIAPIYRLGAHVALLAWLWHQFVSLENGNAYVTITWGAYAIALLAAGLLGAEGEHKMPALYAGISTLLLVVGKLFLVDLTALDPLWRVLLFIGFGGVFLLLSYFFQNVVRGKPGQDSTPGHHQFRFRWPGRPAH